MPVAPRPHRFVGRAALAEALADRVAGALTEGIAARGTALIAVSGGATPGAFFAALSRREIAWDRVTVTLVDERFVPPTSERSNARLVLTTLLQGPASTAKFVPLHHDAASVEESVAQVAGALRDLAWPLDAAILGMGADGHTASFFPDAANLDALTDPSTERLVLPVHAASGDEPRLTLTLPPLVDARLLVLHIEGEAKRSVLDRVLEHGEDLPIGRVLQNAKRPVEIYWAP